MEKKVIAFDMDGTLNRFYEVPNWQENLNASNPAPYMEAEPLWDMAELKAVLNELKVIGWEIRVITWLSKNSTECYKEEVRVAKMEWLEKYEFPYDHFHGVQYGATKADSIRKYADYAILVDDNEAVRNGWHMGATINPVEENIIEVLRNLLK